MMRNLLAILVFSAISYSALSQIQFVLPDTEVCVWDFPITIDGTVAGGLNYNWSGGSSPNTAVNFFSSGGSYALTVTDTNGGVFADTFQIIELDTPGAAINTFDLDTAYYFDASGSLYCTPLSHVLWYFGVDGIPDSAYGPGLLQVTATFPWLPCPPDTFIQRTVFLSIDNGCGTDTIQAVIQCDTFPTSIDHPTHFENSVSLYPNPTLEGFFVRCDPCRGLYDLELTTLSGQLVVSMPRLNFEAPRYLDFNLPTGLYLYHIKKGGEIQYSGKFIRQ